MRAEFVARFLNIRFVITEMFTSLYELDKVLHKNLENLGWGGSAYDESTGKYEYDTFIGKSHDPSTHTFGYHRIDYVKEVAEICSMSASVDNELLRIQKLHVELLRILKCDHLRDDLRFVDEPGEDIIKELRPSKLSLTRLDDATDVSAMAMHEKLTNVTDRITELLIEIRGSFYISDGDHLIRVLQNNRVSVDVHPVVHAVSAVVVSTLNKSGTTTPVY